MRSPLSGLFLVVGKMEESDKAEGEALPLRPNAVSYIYIFRDLLHITMM